jgi:hypothetical protein
VAVPKRFQSIHLNVTAQPDVDVRSVGARPLRVRGAAGEPARNELQDFNSEEAAARYYLAQIMQRDERPTVRSLTAPDRAEVVPDMQLQESQLSPLTNTWPYLSSLVLFDKDMTTGPIRNFFLKKPPVFFVMNACETAAASTPAAGAWKERYDIFGLARAFLETGAYLRWKVGDQGAAAFAQAFYGAFVKGVSLGRALQEGRIACRKATSPDDLSWASYLLYGDPRVRLCL